MAKIICWLVVLDLLPGLFSKIEVTFQTAYLELKEELSHPAPVL